MNDPRRSIKDLMEEIQGHPGMMAHREWQSFSTIHRVMLGNEDELVALIDEVEGNHDFALEVVQNVLESDTKEYFYQELVRRLHNYLSSAKTLVDHTRRLMKHYEGTPTHHEYNERLSLVQKQQVVPTMHRLRNVMLHQRIPPVGVQIRVLDSGSSTAVVAFLNRDSILQDPDCTKSMRAYLSGKPAEVPLRELLSDYASAIEDLYRWIYPEFERLHGTDVAAVNVLIRRLPGRPDPSERGRFP